MFRFLNHQLHYSLILLLIWTPLAFGSVHPWAYSLMEIHIFLLIVTWMIQIIMARRQSISYSRSPVSFICTPLALPLGLFIAVLMVQLVPLTPRVLKFLSPSTYELHSLFLPAWPEAYPTLSLHPYATRLGVSKVLAYAGLFFLIVNTLHTQRSIRCVYLTIVVIASVMALFGIVQKLSGTSAIYWFRDTSYAPFFGPYIHRNHFAGYQAMAIPLGLGLLFAQPTEARSDVPYTWRHLLVRLLGLLSQWRGLLVYALVVMTGALFFSLSRGGVLSFLMGLVLFGLLLRKRRRGRERRVVLVTTLAAMIGMILWLGIAPLLARFNTIAYGEHWLTWNSRLPVFQATWAMAKDFPLFGVGYEAFPVIFPRYQSADAESIQARFLHVHNDFLQLLVETGWVGFVTLMIGMLLLVVDIIKRWQPRGDPFVQVMVPAGLAALCAMTFHSLVDFNMRIPANALLFTAVLALTFACANLPRGSHLPPRIPSQAGL